VKKVAVVLLVMVMLAGSVCVWGNKDIALIDHTHSNVSDGLYTMLLAFRIARALGAQGVIISDHLEHFGDTVPMDFIENPYERFLLQLSYLGHELVAGKVCITDPVQYINLVEQAAKETGLLGVPGVEIALNGKDNHIVVFPLDRYSLGELMDAQKAGKFHDLSTGSATLASIVARYNLVAIAAHPTHPQYPFDLERTNWVNGVECYDADPLAITPGPIFSTVAKLLKCSGKDTTSVLGASDFHWGVGVTALPNEVVLTHAQIFNERTPRAVAEAVRTNRCYASFGLQMKIESATAMAGEEWDPNTQPTFEMTCRGLGVGFYPDAKIMLDYGGGKTIMFSAKVDTSLLRAKLSFRAADVLQPGVPVHGMYVSVRGLAVTSAIRVKTLQSRSEPPKLVERSPGLSYPPSPRVGGKAKGTMITSGQASPPALHNPGDYTAQRPEGSTTPPAPTRSGGLSYPPSPTKPQEPQAWAREYYGERPFGQSIPRLGITPVLVKVYVGMDQEYRYGKLIVDFVGQTRYSFDLNIPPGQNVTSMARRGLMYFRQAEPSRPGTSMLIDVGKVQVCTGDNGRGCYVLLGDMFNAEYADTPGKRFLGAIGQFMIKMQPAPSGRAKP